MSTSDYWWDQRVAAMGYALNGDSVSVDEMSFPVRCKWCHHVHDAAKVTVLQRYADCSTWRCPNCRVIIDDRPGGWGGAIRVERNRA